MKLPVRIKLKFARPSKGVDQSLVYIEPLTERMQELIQKHYGTDEEGKPIIFTHFSCHHSEKGYLPLRLVRELIVMSLVSEGYDPKDPKAEEVIIAGEEWAMTELAMAVAKHLCTLAPQKKKSPKQIANLLMKLLEESGKLDD